MVLYGLWNNFTALLCFWNAHAMATKPTQILAHTNTRTHTHRSTGGKAGGKEAETNKNADLFIHPGQEKYFTKFIHNFPRELYTQLYPI